MRSNKFDYIGVTFFVLIILVLVFGGALWYLWQEYEVIINRPIPQPVVYQFNSVPSSFVDTDVTSVTAEAGTFEAWRDELTANESDFVVVDLKQMIVSLYAGGQPVKTLKVLSKGREGSWWETPTGRYGVLSKETSHFSSIGLVWMPWSVQFYGNFFIHGWPHYSDGTPVSREYSGGCVRLSTEDAKEVFDFVKRGMPILLYDQETKPAILLSLQPTASDLRAPTITAKAALVADLNTGEILLNKSSDEVLPIASLTKLMTAVVASELVYLERSITIQPEMLSSPIQSYPLKIGERYRAFDLLYPLLEQSSNGAASALSSFLGGKYFVNQMNEKAVSLGMQDTSFADPAGVKAANISTLKNMAKLARYILDKRQFLFDISRGKDYPVFGSNVFKGIANYNEFHDSPGIIGVKNGTSDAARETLLSVWRFKQAEEYRTFIVAVLGSEDRKTDTDRLVNWLTKSFRLE
ncbi:L,D-transpeptidase family protein [Candidatus Jorgensenbacteria bacterium]|nr:L,D-transpeptidase family protein [Candidatus Jorgensenbacteria bacterium]